MDRKALFFSRMRNFAAAQQQIIKEVIDELELYLEFRDTKDVAYRNAALPPATSNMSRQNTFDIDSPRVETTTLRTVTDFGGGWKVIEHNRGGDIPQTTSRASITANIPEEEILKYVTKRSDGRWQGAKTVNGKRQYVYAKTQKECYEKLKKLLKTRKTSPKAVTVAEFAEQYLAMYKKGKVAERTYKEYEATVKRFLNVGTPLNKVTTLQLQAIINKMPATRRRKDVYQIIKQVFRKAYELDLVKKNVAEFIELGKIAKADRRALNIDEQTALISALGDDIFSRRVLFYLCTGARPSEIHTVNVEELRAGWVKINGTKTAKAARWVKISERMYDMLKNTEKNFFKFDDKKFRERLQRTCESVGIKYNVNTYTLRHTFATNLYILGVAEKDRQEYLGHVSGSSITNDVYTTFSPDVTPQNIIDIYGDFLPKF